MRMTTKSEPKFSTSDVKAEVSVVSKGATEKE